MLFVKEFKSSISRRISQLQKTHMLLIPDHNISILYKRPVSDDQYFNENISILIKKSVLEGTLQVFNSN
jgi:hypothetical protein